MNIKTNIEGRINAGDAQGQEINQDALAELNDAKKSEEALESLVCLDDEDRAAVSEAINNSKAIADDVAKEFRAAADKVVGELDKISDEAAEYAKVEANNAKIAETMPGQYNAVGDNLASSCMESSNQFTDYSGCAKKTGEQIDLTNAGITDKLKSTF